jgi:threonine dehydrogenase-like Zn-dependent dehydrogenase
VEGTDCQVLSPEEAAALLPKTSDECGIDGIDILIDCTGFPPALEQALKWMKRGGTVCVYGCAPPGKALK